MEHEAAHGYRYALTRPGVAPFTAAGAVARLPIAMIALAIVLLVSNQTGSYGYAGVLSALFAFTSAFASIVTSRRADRVGQRRILLLLAPAHSLLLVAFTSSILLDWGAIPQVALVVAAGATLPAIGSYVRARWSYLSDSPDMLRVGFAWESVLDELIFTIGPIITTTLAFSIGLGVPIVVAAVFVAVGSLGLMMARRSTPPAAQASSHPGSMLTVVRTPGLRALVIAALGMGTLFGSLDVGTVAFTQARSQGELSGLILAGFAVSSLICGIAYGARRWPGDLRRHVQVATTALTVIALFFLVVDTSVGLAVVAVAAGGSVAPALIGIFSLTERLVPARNLTEGLTWTNSGLATGFALGSATSGWLIDLFATARAGFVVCVVGATVAALVTFLRSGTLGGPGANRLESVEPTFAWNDDPLPGPHPMA